MAQNDAVKTLVCIGFAEALSGPEVAWSLIDAGFEVIAFGRRARRSALRHSRFVTTVEITPPEQSVKSAVADFERFLASYHNAHYTACVLLPLDDAALWLCSQPDLESGWTFAGPQGPNAALALDKSLQTAMAKAAGFRVPETTYAVAADDVLRRIDELPLILKPAKAVFELGNRLWKGRNWICADRKELEMAVAEWKGAWPMLVQPFIHGTGQGVFGLATGDGVLMWSAHRRLRMMNPHGSGSSACTSIPVPEDLRVPVERFIRASGWLGMFMIELLVDSTGNVWFVELNGRSWGSMALSRRQGFEYPAWTVKQLLNTTSLRDLEPPGTGRFVCRNVGRECMHLLFVLRGPESKAVDGTWPPFWRTTIDMLNVRSGDSLYNWRRDDARVFFSDWWYTISNQLFKARE